MCMKKIQCHFNLDNYYMKTIFQAVWISYNLNQISKEFEKSMKEDAECGLSLLESNRWLRDW